MFRRSVISLNLLDTFSGISHGDLTTKTRLYFCPWTNVERIVQLKKIKQLVHCFFPSPRGLSCTVLYCSLHLLQVGWALSWSHTYLLSGRTQEYIDSVNWHNFGLNGSHHIPVLSAVFTVVFWYSVLLMPQLFVQCFVCHMWTERCRIYCIAKPQLHPFMSIRHF